MVRNLLPNNDNAVLHALLLPCVWQRLITLETRLCGAWLISILGYVRGPPMQSPPMFLLPGARASSPDKRVRRWDCSDRDSLHGGAATGIISNALLLRHYPHVSLSGCTYIWATNLWTNKLKIAQMFLIDEMWPWKVWYTWRTKHVATIH